MTHDIHPEVLRHETRTVTLGYRPGEHVHRGWQARCKCGWEGEERNVRVDAEDDESVHMTTEIPDDMPGSIYR